MTETQTILVTGASGFIAKHIVRDLLAHGYRVRGTLRALDRSDSVRAAVTDGQPDHSDRLEFVAADLTSDAGWDEAAAGVGAVLHTASPFPGGAPKHEDDLIVPAVEGTKRVLRAAQAQGIERVVLTSSIAAVHGGHPERTHFDASIWTDVEHPSVQAYYKSKTLAERAAWTHVAESGQALTAVNPALVAGPALDARVGTSLDLVAMLLKGKVPVVPRIAVGVVDVRDVARLHRLALEHPETAGQRLLASDQVMWFSEIARCLGARYPERKIASRALPDWTIRLAAKVAPGARQFVPDLSKDWSIDAEPGRALLGGFVPAREALIASADSLIAHGLVK